MKTLVWTESKFGKRLATLFTALQSEIGLDSYLTDHPAPWETIAMEEFDHAVVEFRWPPEVPTWWNWSRPTIEMGGIPERLLQTLEIAEVVPTTLIVDGEACCRNVTELLELLRDHLGYEWKTLKVIDGKASRESPF